MLTIALGIYLSQSVQLKSIYMKSLTEIIDYKSGAQKSFKYIAIDLDTLKGLDDYEKAEVIDYIESKYNVEIKDASYTDLIANGIVAKFH